jgi:hypothetical protein
MVIITTVPSNTRIWTFYSQNVQSNCWYFPTKNKIKLDSTLFAGKKKTHQGLEELMEGGSLCAAFSFLHHLKCKCIFKLAFKQISFNGSKNSPCLFSIILKNSYYYHHPPLFSIVKHSYHHHQYYDYI